MATPEQNMSVDPNMSTEQNMSVAPQTPPAAPMSTPTVSGTQQPNMSTPLGPAQGGVSSGEPNMSTPLGPAQGGIGPTRPPAEQAQQQQTSVATGEGAKKEEVFEVVPDPVEEKEKVIDLTRKEREATDDAPSTTETTTKVNDDGGTTVETKQYQTPEAKEYEQSLRDYDETLDDEYEYLSNAFDRIQDEADEAQATLLAAIKATYEVRIKEQKKINRKQLQTTTAIGNRQNRTRYAPDLQSSILTAEESEGIDRLEALDAKFLTTMAEVQAAQTAQDLDILTARTRELRNIRTEQFAVMNNLYNLSVQEESRTQLRQELSLKNEQETQQTIINKIKTFGTTGAEFTDDEVAIFSQKLGLNKDAVRSYIGAQQEIYRAASTADQAAALQSVMNALQQAPSDFVYRFDINGETHEFKGMDYGNNKIFSEFNRATNTSTFLTFNEAGELINTETVTGAGTPYQVTGGTSIRNGMIGSDGNILSFDQWIATQEDSMQENITKTTIGPDGLPQESEMYKKYKTQYYQYLGQAFGPEALYKSLDANLKNNGYVGGITETQARSAIDKFLTINPDKTAYDFYALPASEQNAYDRRSVTQLQENPPGPTSGTSNANAPATGSFDVEGEEETGGGFSIFGFNFGGGGNNEDVEFNIEGVETT